MHNRGADNGVAHRSRTSEAVLVGGGDSKRVVADCRSVERGARVVPVLIGAGGKSSTSACGAVELLSDTLALLVGRARGGVRDIGRRRVGHGVGNSSGTRKAV